MILPLFVLASGRGVNTSFDIGPSEVEELEER